MISRIEQRGRDRFREGLALVLLGIAALLFQRSATSAWAEAVAADGTRIEISPIGLAKFPSASASQQVAQCRWWPRLGDLELCAVAPDGTEAFAWLRRAYPLTVVALWTSVLALFLNALRIPRRVASVRIVATAAVPALAGVALWSLSTSTTALTVLRAREIRPLLPGLALVVTATALSMAALLLLISSQGSKTHQLEQGVS